MSKIENILLVIHYSIYGAACFQFTQFPLDGWENILLCLIIIINSEVWTIIHCLGLDHETMVCAVCLFIFLYIQSISQNIYISFCNALLLWLCNRFAIYYIYPYELGFIHWYCKNGMKCCITPKDMGKWISIQTTTNHNKRTTVYISPGIYCNIAYILYVVWICWHIQVESAWD